MLKAVETYWLILNVSSRQQDVTKGEDDPYKKLRDKENCPKVKCNIYTQVKWDRCVKST